MWARIDIDSVGRFHPSLVWVECPERTRQGYIYEKGSFTPPDEVS